MDAPCGQLLEMDEKRGAAERQSDASKQELAAAQKETRSMEETLQTVRSIPEPWSMCFAMIRGWLYSRID